MDRRLAGHYVSRCTDFAVKGRRQLPEWLAWMEVEVDSVRAVLDRLTRVGDATAVSLAIGLVYFWGTRATSEGARRFDGLLASHRGHLPAAAYYIRGFLGVLQNDPGVTSILAEGVDIAREQSDPMLSQLLAMSSIAATMSTDVGTARRLLAQARQIAAGTDDVAATLLVHQATALNALIAGDAPSVVAASVPGVVLSREIGDQYSLQMLLMNLGLGCLMLNEIRDADRHLSEALAIARDLDDRVAQCYLLGGLGCCAVRTGDHRRGAQLFGAMEVLCTEAGATLNAGLVRVLTPATAAATKVLRPEGFASAVAAGRRLGRVNAVGLALRDELAPGVITRSAAEPASTLLGRRELEVAQLVAQGCTNKGIASRMFLSERNVESHVRNTLNKLGFSSRSQIAAWVAAGTH